MKPEELCPSLREDYTPSTESTASLGRSERMREIALSIAKSGDPRTKREAYYREMVIDLLVDIEALAERLGDPFEVLNMTVTQWCSTNPSLHCNEDFSYLYAVFHEAQRVRAALKGGKP